MLRACLLLPTALAVPIQPDGAAGKTLTIELVSFAEGAKNAFTWTDLNDPVMGGRSTSTFKVEHGRGVFDGVCRIVPQLKVSS